MSSENSFTKIPRNGRPLLEFLRESHHLFADQPARLLTPLIDDLAETHAAGQSHGSIMPGCILVFPNGEFDIGFLNSRRGHPDMTDLRTYYPDGATDVPEEARERDIKALGAVLHLIVADQPPSWRNLRSLGDNPDAKSWPAAFIAMIDQMLAGTATLAEVSASLASAPAPPPEQPAPPAELPPPPASPAPPASAPATLVRTPNAMVGRVYTCEIQPPEKLGKIAVSRLEVLSPPPAGLAFSESTLLGKPETDGDFEFSVRLHFSEAQSADLILALTINPDPRSLWKNQPSNENGEFWKKDRDTAFLENGPLHIIGASLRGRSHAHVGSCRDDDMAMSWFPETEWYSLTVADGAGSSKYSRRGSKIACDTVKEFFTDRFASPECKLNSLVTTWASAPNDLAANTLLRNQLYDLFGKAAYAAYSAIEKEAAGLHAAIRDFHTTLITSLLHPLPDGKWFAATFSIGDGAAAIVGAPGGDPCLLTRPDGGEFAGQTVFLTMKEALASAEAIMGRIKFVLVPNFKALLLVTDGISDPRFDSDANLADPAAWDSLWDEILPVISPATTSEGAAVALLEWMDFHSPGHHDDRTTIIATHRQP